MSCLLYCIFQTSLSANMVPTQEPAVIGVNKQPVFLVATNGLSAALSKIARSDSAPSLAGLLSYAKVIESFHRDGAVIPMRYGCLLDDEHQVVRLLGEGYKRFATLLKEMEGCVEMGIRVLTSGSEHCQVKQAESDSSNAKTSTPGRAYLGTRKSHYAQEDRCAEEVKAIMEYCSSAFAGLLVKCKIEVPVDRLRQSSFRIPFPCLHFLVLRSSVDAFRRTFREITLERHPKLLLSGPWPPYNFVPQTKLDPL